MERPDAGSNAGGFDFELVKRNAMLAAKGVRPPTAWKTGTTIAGVIYKVMAAKAANEATRMTRVSVWVAAAACVAVLRLITCDHCRWHHHLVGNACVEQYRALIQVLSMIASGASAIVSVPRHSRLCCQPALAHSCWWPPVLPQAAACIREWQDNDLSLLFCSSTARHMGQPMTATLSKHVPQIASGP